MAVKKGIPVIDGFALKGKLYLDNRTEVESAADLAGLTENHYPDGFIVYAHKEKRYFQYDSSNVSDGRLYGKWREVNIEPAPPSYVDEEKHILYL